jgi:hypothetical protein
MSEERVTQALFAEIKRLKRLRKKETDWRKKGALTRKIKLGQRELGRLKRWSEGAESFKGGKGL